MPPRHTDFQTLIRFAGPNDCWEWTGSKTPRGYGRLGPRWAHRISYEHYHGPIAEGLVVRHRCDNPGCVNPNHLEVGTQQDNMDDIFERKIRPFIEGTPLKRLGLSTIRFIRENPDGLTVEQLVRRTFIPYEVVARIRATVAE